MPPYRSVVISAVMSVVMSAVLLSQQLQYAPDLTIDLAKGGMRGVDQMIVNKRGKMVVVHAVYPRELIAFDSLGRKNKWPLQIGRRSAKSDISVINNTGWVGDSMWIADTGFDQLAVIDSSGRLVRSIERPSWVRPFWRDRRKYPLFRGLNWQALYPDGTMLVIPLSPRALFDSPVYDRSKMHLLRVNADGKILRTVARVPAGETRLQLRDGMERTQIGVPFFAKTSWKVSEDGQRIAIVRPLTTASDSGAFRVTTLNANGDTLFSRRYSVETRRVPTDEVEKTLATVKPFGRYSAEWIRDTLRKQVPVFESRVLNVGIGVDHSIWVWLRSPIQETRAFVIDANGDPVGTVAFPPPWKLGALSVDRVWTTQRIGSLRNPMFNIVRLQRVTATAARPSRSASASASPRRSTPRQ